MRAPPRTWAGVPLRTRLVAGFTGAMLVLLAGAGSFVYWRVQFALDRGLDTDLTSATGVISPLVAADGQVRAVGAADATGAGWQVLSGSGAVLSSGGPVPDAPYVDTTRLADLTADGDATVDLGRLLPVATSPFRVRITALPTEDGGAGPAAPAWLAVGLRRDHRDEALRELVLQLLLAGAGALVVAAGVGDALARLALRPVERYRVRAAQIATGATGLRLDVPPERDDEVTRLGHTLNAMLAAQQEALERERQFVQDASHELRTPLAVLRLRLQLVRSRDRSPEEYRQSLDELSGDVAALVALAQQLLELDAVGHAAGGSSDLTNVVSERVGGWRAAHPTDDVRLTADGTDVLWVPVEEVVMHRVITNLLGNAFAHGRPPVLVRVRATAGGAGRHVVLEVADAGEGMSDDLLGTATHRFTRAPEARGRPGAGLGLALVEQLVVGAGGELRLCHAGRHRVVGSPLPVPCDHDARMTVTVVLPAAPAFV